MGNKADVRRRWMGAIFLMTAVLMLIAGETILAERLRQNPWFLIFYWALCFGSVFFAIVIAVLDLRIIRSRIRAEHRGLLEETLGKIASQKGTKTNPGHDASEKP